MKHLKFFLMIVAFCFSSLPQLTLADERDGYYFYLSVSGNWTKNGTAYISGLMHYPGYRECKRADYDMLKDAEWEFGKYLDANHNAPYLHNNILTLNQPLYSANERIKTRKQAEERLNDWVADQKKQGYRVEYTHYTYRCG